MATSRHVCHTEISGTRSFGHIFAIKLHSDWLSHKSSVPVPVPGFGCSQADNLTKLLQENICTCRHVSVASDRQIK